MLVRYFGCSVRNHFHRGGIYKLNPPSDFSEDIKDVSFFCSEIRDTPELYIAELGISQGQVWLCFVFGPIIDEVIDLLRI